MLKNVRDFVANRKKGVSVATALVGGLVMSGAANAALPTAATEIFTSITTDATSAIDLGWPLMLAITGGLILMGIVKKVLGRSAS